MFESDDFDEVLSQFEIPEVLPQLKTIVKENVCEKSKDIPLIQNKVATENVQLDSTNDKKLCNTGSTPKHIKRKIINSYFDHTSKRKFPGPAGILSGNFQEPKDDSVCHIELLSQDIDFTQNNLQRELFESPLWSRLQYDIKQWNISSTDSIKDIKNQAVAGNLRRRKAQIVAAFVEAVDRSVIDPLVILRDTTGSIKCTLHRDVWSKFSHYIVADYCALVLLKPTVLTTGSAFKKHYLNITQSNLLEIYSSALLNNEENTDISIPGGYDVVYKGEFTVIKAQFIIENIDVGNNSNNAISFCDNMMDDLDSVFSDEIF